MCTSQEDGGKRCATHTRPLFEAATYGTPEWEKAAADYGRTNQGKAHLAEAVTKAVGERDWERAAASEQALSAAARADEVQAEVNRRTTHIATTARSCQDAERLRQFASSGSMKVRRAVAANRHTPADVLTQMAFHDRESVRADLAARNDLPDDAYRALLRDSSTEVNFVMTSITRNRPEVVLRDWASDASAHKRSLAAYGVRDARLADMLGTLASDKEATVRGAVAGSRNAPAEVLTRLATDPNSEVAERALVNANLPAAALEPALRAQSARLQSDEFGAADVRQQVLARLEREGMDHLASYLVGAGR